MDMNCSRCSEEIDYFLIYDCTSEIDILYLHKNNLFSETPFRELSHEFFDDTPLSDLLVAHPYCDICEAPDFLYRIVIKNNVNHKKA